MASTYDEALAEALGDEESVADVVERLRAGEADGNERRSALERLDDETRHRFELAHPVPPRETAIEVDLGEVELADVKTAVKEAADEADGREILVKLSVRVESKSHE